jgi:cytochrome c oxidase subunit 4
MADHADPSRGQAPSVGGLAPSGAHHEEDSHPSDSQYVKVAIVLAVVTIAEVAVYYVGSLQRLLVPLLLSMSLVKFFLVAMWFMHLKFDSKLFRRLFVLGIVIAVSVFGVVLVSFGVFVR